MRVLLLIGASFALAAQVQVIPPPPPPPPPPPRPPIALNGQTIVPGGGGTPVAPISQTGENAIELSVKRLDNDDAIGNAQATLIATGTSVPRELTGLTDSGGKIAFRNLPDGQYLLRADRENFFGPLADGAAQPSAFTLVNVDPLHKSVPATLKLTPAGAIQGFVRDANGQPAFNVPVAALRLTYRDGRRTLQSAKINQSDDRGQYRLWGLPPGDYYVRAGGMGPLALPGGSSFIFYPGVSDPTQATLLKIRGADETVADLPLPSTSAPSFKVSGKFTNGIPELAYDPFAFLLMPHEVNKLDEGTFGNIFPNQAGAKMDGSFEVLVARPGTYELMAVAGIRRDLNGPPTAQVTPAVPGSPQFFTGHTTVEVRDRDVEGITISVTRGADIEVRLNPGAVPAAALQNLRLGLRPLAAVPTPVTQHVSLVRVIPQAGRLTFVSVPDGSYAITGFVTPPGFYISDIRQGPRTIYDDGAITVGRGSAEPVDIMLSSGGGKVEGTIEMGENTPVRVSLVPQGPRRNNSLFYKRITPTNGAFTLPDVPPGNYKLYAWDDVPAGADENADFMAPYEEQGRAVSVSAGGTVTGIKLQVIRTR